VLTRPSPNKAILYGYCPSSFAGQFFASHNLLVLLVHALFAIALLELVSHLYNGVDDKLHACTFVY